MRIELVTHGMEYNSEQEHLIMPEYGRNVQKLVRYAQSIEDDEVRQNTIEEIVTLIQQLYPQSKSIDDYREKLWKHIFKIAKYDLKAVTPSGEVPTPETDVKKLDFMPYPVIETRYRHYGHNIQTLIKKAIAMEDPEKKKEFVNTIGSYMKLAYRTWNKEHFVSDELIIQDLIHISGGKLSFEEDQSFENIILKKSANPRQGTFNKNNKYKNNNNRNNNNRNSNTNNRNNNNNNNNRFKKSV
jgi:Domain of unknown function (DUF4290)